MVWHRSGDGQSMVEYALIIALMALIVLVALTLIGPQVSTVFSQIASSIN